MVPVFGTYQDYKWTKKVVDRIRTALGQDVSILILSPPPMGKWTKAGIIPVNRIQKITEAKRDSAIKLKCAFWDYMKASGGLKKISQLCKKGFYYNDLIHTKPKFQKQMSWLLYGVLRR